MKKIISILAFTSLLCCSCDYLDVVPEGKATEEDIWKTTEQADKFRYYLQTYMPNLIGYDWSPDQFAGDDFITGARGTTYYFSSKSLLYNEETSSNTYFGRWEPSSVSGGTNYDIYRGIRYCYYMLDNVYKVPVISPENADRYAGEAWFLIGYYHQCLLEYYGPVILVKRFIPIDAPEEEIFVPRTPYDDCVKFIADCYDKAAGLLPETVVPAELGMPTKMAALSYKARLLLYAASPLVNGNPDYVGFNNPDGTPLMNTTYDREKWKLAMDAAEAAIQLSEKTGQNGGKQNYYLYTNIDSTLDEFEQGVKNYHGAFVDQLWNGEEFIMAKGAETGIQNIQRYGGPRSIAGDMSKGWKTTCVPTMEAVEMYYTKNGGTTITLKLRGGELHGSTLKETDEYQSCTGYVCQKWISRTSYYDKSLNTYTYTRYAYPYLRLAELYLSYAEADFEYNGSLSGKSLEYINRVRRRCGLPDFEDSWALAGGIPSGQKLRKVLHQERSIEFLFEGRRFHDLRRWKEAPEVMNKQPRSWNRDAKTQDDFYQVIQAAQGGRVLVFESPKSYWLAIPLNQINKNPQLVQNPGY